jgi:hypothetical protein
LSFTNKINVLAIFDRLITFGEKHFNDSIKIDYFAVSLSDMQVFNTDMDQKNRIHSRYLQTLGYLGKRSEGEIEKTEAILDMVLKLHVNHQGAIVNRKTIKLKFFK